MIIDRYKRLPHSFNVNGGPPGVWAVWRWIALATLVVWATALGLCTAHCALGIAAPGMENKSLPPCHGGGGPDPHDDDSQSSGSGSFCITIKSLSAETFPPVLDIPDAPALFQPALATHDNADALSPTFVKPSRRQSERVSPFMHEVSLAPAHLPHGPPVLC